MFLLAFVAMVAMGASAQMNVWENGGLSAQYAIENVDSVTFGITSETPSSGTGKDGITPLLKIENDYWYISYDEGQTWQQEGKAKGEKGDKGDKGDTGEKGEKGDKGDAMFLAFEQDGEYVYLTLPDSSKVKIAKVQDTPSAPNEDDIIEFKDLAVKSALLNSSLKIDTNGDGEISYKEAANTQGRLTLCQKINGTEKLYSFKEFKYFTNVTSCVIGAETLFEIEFPDVLDTIIQCDGKFTSIKLPKSCKYIATTAFRTMNNDGTRAHECPIKSIIWNDSIEYIGAQAFANNIYNCTSLPNSIKIVDRDESGSPGIRISAKEFAFPYDFQGKPGGVDLQNVETIYWNTNQFTTSYSWTRGSSLTHYGLSDYGPKEAYSSPDTTIKKVVFGSAVKNIPAYLCYYLWGLTEVDIPDNVENIESCSFQGCGYLQKITIGKGVSTIGYKAFDFGYYVSNPKIYCKATTPPIIDGDVFYSSIIIYVPRASVEEYRTLWSNYANKIVGYDFE